ncbi:hypothetical protein SAMN02799630_02255 [Paenibacillus sp. UNCCL117]|uniref:hypothetical protein n=1 Tax=unclassified Paenibacillus TaxID=185978 RepID=UPI000889A5D7|nr:MULTISPECIES: hypothetical protein [unclassified Paenibacillus]SDD15323.1 hypothetical protein SAMN04488602_106131 [Paenibacillus sp. cl123]SFW34422.1 hypothetical protein SAMN02799630_02255 [Paenibacillus sp. UNCCL117]
MAYCHNCPPLSPIVTAPTQVYNNFYYPQAQPIVHPVEVINQHHCVPVPQHYVTYTEKDVVVSSVKKRKKRK